MKISFTNRSNADDERKKKFWEAVAENQFQGMDEDARAQWAELR